MQWLRWVEAQLDRPLQHARNQGEFRIPDTRYTVDGYDATTRTVYEFHGCYWHGCYWHGCPRCHPQRQETHAWTGRWKMPIAPPRPKSSL